MRRTTSAWMIVAATLLGSTALAQSPKTEPPGQAKGADAAKKVDDKGHPAAAPGKDGASGKSESGDKATGKVDTAPGKADGKADPSKADPAAAQGATPADGKEPVKDEAAVKEQMARKTAQRDAARAKVVAALKGQAMTEPMKLELRRHAQRVARLDRIVKLAQEAKDDAATDKAKKLIEKENARHDRWMANFDPKAETKVGAK